MRHRLPELCHLNYVGMPRVLQVPSNKSLTSPLTMNFRRGLRHIRGGEIYLLFSSCGKVMEQKSLSESVFSLLKSVTLQ